MRPPLPAVAALLLTLGWPVALFGPAVLAGGVLAPADGIGMYLPQRAVVASAWQAGQWPFWHPFQFGGMPLLAVIQAGVFFPGNWTFLWLPPGAAMNLTVLLAYWVAGLGAWLYGRAIGLAPVGLLVAGLAFVGSGYMVAHLEHITMLQAAGLIPVLFWLVERAIQSGSLRHVLAVPPVLALQVFAGYPQTVVMTAMMLVPYAVWRGWRRGATGRTVVVALAAAAALGLGLAAIQVAPTAALMAESSRGVMTYAELVDDAVPWRELPALLFPYMYGTVPEGLFQVPFWGKGPWRDELMGYPGLATLLLAGVAVLGAWRDGLVRAWCVVAAGAGVLALGGQTPLYRLWYELPVLRMVRVPGRHLLEVDLALAMLAGLGASWLLAASPGVRRRVAARAVALVGGAMLLVAAGVALGREVLADRWQPHAPPGLDVALALDPRGAWCWVPLLTLVATAVALGWLVRVQRALAGATLAGVLAADLLVFGWHQGWRQQLPAAAQVALAAPLAPHDRPRILPLPTRPYPYQDVAATLAVGYPQTSALANVRAVNGYEPIVPARYAGLMGRMAMGGGMTAGPAVLLPGHHGLDVLQCETVRIEAALAARPPWAAALAAPRWQRLGMAGSVAVFRNVRALPRAWRPGLVRGVSAERLAAQVTADSAWDPLAEALVDGSDPAPRVVTSGPVRVTTRGFGLIEVETKGPGPGLVVVSEGYAAGWRALAVPPPLARLGGFAPDVELALALGWLPEHPVVRAYGLVLGVPVPAGHQRFTLVYRPPHWQAAGLASVAAGAIWLAWALVAWRRRRGWA
ncbi:MAG: hypothetical protein VKQ33_06725 [Candidatus Sericytochromatia bacterium]|nr:hypothetical protein [Candidatus Sericytochromatia bacterium]